MRDEKLSETIVFFKKLMVFNKKFYKKKYDVDFYGSLIYKEKKLKSQGFSKLEIKQIINI